MQAARFGGDAFGQAGEQEQPGQVGADHRLEVRADHLDHHFLAAAQLRGVYLGDRGGGQRLAVEAREQAGDLGAELFLDQRHRVLGIERRHLVLEEGQLVGDVRRQQVAAGRQQLAELDEDRPEVLQRQAQAFAARQVQLPARQPAPGQQEARGGQPPGQRQGEQQVVEAVADDHALDGQ
ncbi:hypothetical protein D9M68_640120 [compost metagenome]